MYQDELKRKLRELKKLEIIIRFNDKKLTGKERLVFDSFFSMKEGKEKTCKYTIRELQPMSHEEFKEIIGEYFYSVYFEYYKENGITSSNLYNPRLLEILGLPMDASLEDVKIKFRALALKYHPDKGGDSESFIELVDVYKKLTENK